MIIRHAHQSCGEQVCVHHVEHLCFFVLTIICTDDVQIYVCVIYTTGHNHGKYRHAEMILEVVVNPKLKLSDLAQAGKHIKC